MILLWAMFILGVVFGMSLLIGVMEYMKYKEYKKIC